MVERELTTITIYKNDKRRFNKIYDSVNEELRIASDVPKELFKPKTKAEIFSVIMDIIEKYDVD